VHRDHTKPKKHTTHSMLVWYHNVLQMLKRRSIPTAYIETVLCQEPSMQTHKDTDTCI
jgi:hypothetical protein